MTGLIDTCTHNYLLHVLIQAQFISQCVSEIKKELKQGNIANKANAISKLTYVST